MEDVRARVNVLSERKSRNANEGGLKPTDLILKEFYVNIGPPALSFLPSVHSKRISSVRMNDIEKEKEGSAAFNTEY